MGERQAGAEAQGDRDAAIRRAWAEPPGMGQTGSLSLPRPPGWGFPRPGPGTGEPGREGRQLDRPAQTFSLG